VTSIAVSEAKVLAALDRNVRSGSPRSALALRGVDQVARGRDLHGHVGQHELHALEVGDGLAELLALLDVGDRGVERALRDADGLRADHRAGVVERLERGEEAGALLADHPVGRDAAVLEVDLAGRRALDAELALLGADGEAGVVGVHDEGRDALAALLRVGDGHDRVVRVDAGAGDPALGAVEHVGVAVADGARLHRAGVGAGLPLGQPVGERRLAGGDLRQVARLQVLAAGQDQPHRAELVAGHDQRRRRADPGHLLDHDRVGDAVGARPAVLLRHVQRQQVGALELGVHVPRVLGRLVDLGGAGGDLVLGQLPHGLAQELVLLGERVQGVRRVHGSTLSGGSGWAHRRSRPPTMRGVTTPFLLASSADGDRYRLPGRDARGVHGRAGVRGAGAGRRRGQGRGRCGAGRCRSSSRGLDELLVKQLESGRLRFTTSFEEVGAVR
jgi:hypothetical protein